MSHFPGGQLRETWELLIVTDSEIRKVDKKLKPFSGPVFTEVGRDGRGTWCSWSPTV